MIKKLLSDTTLHQHFLAKESLISDNHLLNHAHSCDEKISNDIFNYEKDYYKLKDNQQVFWLLEYIKDIFDLNNDLPLVLLKSGVIKLKPGQSLSSHNHLDKYDINNSPDITCLYGVKVKSTNVDDWSKNSYIMLEYDDHRWSQKKYQVPIEHRKFVLFNSSINHSVYNNDNDDIILFSFQFQTWGTATK
tara:strand:- start:4249 stop:4818 length:570 start_codon:yes stop_codon:yes gene_type:complete